MKHERNKPSHISLVSGAYYYVALVVLTLILVTVTFWQVQRDLTVVNMSEYSKTLGPNDRAFYVPVSFCNQHIQEFQIERYYFNTDESVYYSVPSSRFLAAQEESEDGCFNTMVSAFTGALEPGQYEYRIFISYSINPIQKTRRQAALVHVTVE